MMNEKDHHTSLYVQIRDFAQQFQYDFIDGVTIEIREFFQQREEILAFTVVFDLENSHYKVVARIKDFTTDVRKIFLHFLQFISYAGATLYAREETSTSIHYMIASVNYEGMGFYCDIDFVADDATEKQLIEEHAASNERFKRHMEETKKIAGPESNAKDFHGSEEDDVPELPRGWFSAFAFSALHEIPPYVVHDEIKRARFPAVRGDWKQGQSRIKEALDLEGQRAFYCMYHTYPEFRACPDCPHGWQEV